MRSSLLLPIPGRTCLAGFVASPTLWDGGGKGKTEDLMSDIDGNFYSLQLRLVTGLAGEPAGDGVELIAVPEGPGEPHRAHFDHWESLSHRLAAVASSTPFHLKAMYRTVHAGLT